MSGGYEGFTTDDGNDPEISMCTTKNSGEKVVKTNFNNSGLCLHVFYYMCT